jgi:hypothetical protein
MTARNIVNGVFSFFFSCWSTSVAADSLNTPIERHAVVMRHNPVLRQFDVNSPFSVGNGEFAFTVDATGLQTFSQEFEQTTPLGTLSQWAWHTAPNPQGWSMDRFHYKEYECFGRKVGYADIFGNKRTPEINWLRSNPHRLHLGKIGFHFVKSDGTISQSTDLTDIQQTLDLWNGVIKSHFVFEGQPVDVQTICHPDNDLIAVQVVSPLLQQGKLSIQIQFPYGTGDTKTADWNHPDAHSTKMICPNNHEAIFQRTLDNDSYVTASAWSSAAIISEEAKHKYVLTPARTNNQFEFVCAFSPKRIEKKLLTFKQTFATTQAHWNYFWSTGGAVDLSGSKDSRWMELERRIVLSQYLTAIQCAGSFPPQETGLTYNSWEGKFHLEMHWWHAVHFALWDRLPMLERSLQYYQSILPKARANARRQGYAGARWPKMTDTLGNDSPSPIGPFLIWQQPHPIYYAELCYREHYDLATLQQYQQVVFATAEFMASYAQWDATSNRYILGPILECAQEIFPKDKTINPTFELAYWRWGLETAQRWRERLGLKRDSVWDHVLNHLAKPTVRDGKYLFTESTPESYTNPRWAKDHPSVTAALGMLPGPGIDTATMRNTLDWIWTHWNWPDTWGWDYPMVAMCAARVGEPKKAVDALLMDTPKNVFQLNGQNYQRPGLSIYLPGNGGLLTAIAMMCAGWDEAPTTSAPGFPNDGQWNVRWENLTRMP